MTPEEELAALKKLVRDHAEAYAEHLAASERYGLAFAAWDKDRDNESLRSTMQEASYRHDVWMHEEICTWEDLCEAAK